MERCRGHTAAEKTGCWGNTQCQVTQTRAVSPWDQLNRNSPTPAASTKAFPSAGRWPATGTHRCPGPAHLSFLRSPRATGLTAILGRVEAEVWDWLQEDRVSTLRGDCGGVLHSECDKEPAGRHAGDASPGPASQFSSSQDPKGGRHDRDTQPHAAATPHGPEFRYWALCGLSIPHVTRPEATLSQCFLTG